MKNETIIFKFTTLFAEFFFDVFTLGCVQINKINKKHTSANKTLNVGAPKLLKDL